MVLGNCIGMKNYKFFYLLQFWTAIGGLNLLFWFIFGIKVHKFGSNDTLYFWVQYVLPIIFCVMITFGSWGQVVINTYLLLKNRTQMEIMEDFQHNIYDTGNFLENMKEVMGDNCPYIYWLFPIEAGDQGDGYNFFFHYYSA